MAAVTVIEFLDPQCESCRRFAPFVKEILKENEGNVRLIVRYMPFHPNSVYAASVLEATRDKGKYFEALEVLFENQPEWGDIQNPKTDLIFKYLAALGLDESELRKKMADPVILERIQLDQHDGEAFGVDGTPSFFVNGNRVSDLSPESLRKAIAAARAPQA